MILINLYEQALCFLHYAEWLKSLFLPIKKYLLSKIKIFLAPQPAKTLALPGLSIGYSELLLLFLESELHLIDISITKLSNYEYFY